MSFDRLLEERREAILDDWFARIAAGYPPEMRDFLQKGKDRFGNPVGSAVVEGTRAVFDGLRRGADRRELAILLDTTLRIRAVQSFSPSAAVGFVLELKHVVRDAFAKEIRRGEYAKERLALEERIDEALLVAFDGYAACREQILRLHADDMRKTTLGLLEHSGITVSARDTDTQGGRR